MATPNRSIASLSLLPVPKSYPLNSCQGCGLKRDPAAWLDARVPASVWDRIKPTDGFLCVNCLSRRCVDADLTDVPLRIERGPFSVVSRSTSEWYLTQFDAHLRSQDKAEKTIYNYVCDVRMFAGWLASEGRSTNLLAIDSETVIAYRNHLQQVGRKPNTINRNLVSLRIYFDWLLLIERVLRNPVKHVRRVAQVRPKPRKLSADEVERFMAAVKEHGKPRDHAFFSLLIHTGLRSAEARELKWDALTMHRTPAMVEVRGGKGNKYRVVPLNGPVLEALTAYRETLPQAPSRHDYVFGDGRPFAQKTMHNALRRLADLAGVSDVSAHDFRHYFAYQIVKDTPIHILQELMGHSDIGTTTIYTGPTMDDLVQATARLV